MYHFFGMGLFLSQLDGEGMRVMEQQQQRQMKEAYQDHAVRSLASSDSDNISHHLYEVSKHMVAEIKELMTC